MSVSESSLDYSGKLAPFPRDRFETFLGQLKVASKDAGLVPFRLLGSQRYMMDEIARGLDEGVSTFYILKSRQIGACHDPSMRVLTADLVWKRIGDIEIGERLVACDEDRLKGRGRGRRMRTCEVLGTHRVVRPAAALVLDNDIRLVASYEHPYLTRKRTATDTIWRPVGKMRLGDEIRAVTPPWNETTDEETRWFGGLLDGEGSFRPATRSGADITLSQVDGPVWDRARAYVEREGYAWHHDIDKREPGDSSKFGSKPVNKIVISRMSDVFRILGRTRPSRFIDRGEWWVGKELPIDDSYRRVVSMRDVGEQELVDLYTSTGTYICEGVVSHNTTLCLAIDMFWAFEHKGLLGTFILHKEEARDDWRQTIDVFYHEIPTKADIEGSVVKFRPGLERHNRNILSFKNGSRFRYLIAGTQEKRRGGLGRSGSTNYLHATEAAFYGDEEGLRAFRTSTSSIYPYRLQIFESTANGFNWYEEAYTAGKSSPSVRCIFVGWWRDERNVFSTEHPLYAAYAPDRKLTAWERKRVNAVKREYGVDITMGQIAWYRWKLAEDFNNDESTALEEMPWTDEDAFQASGAKYFTSESLTDAIKAARSTPFLSYRYRLGMRFEETVVVAESRQHVTELRVWEQSSKYGHYVIGCDPAYGSSDRADRTVISVWRAYADFLVQVAEFATPAVSTYQCAWVLAHIAGFYGQLDCRVILEITGPGTAVWQELQQLKMRLNELKPAGETAELRNVFKHMRDYMYKKADSLDGGLAYHWKMTDDLKRRVMAQLKDAIELRRMIPRSVHLLEECRHIVSDEGHIEAEGGYKDDRVVAAALAHEAWRMWSLPVLRSQRLTFERSRQMEATGGDKPLDMHIRDYLKAQRISEGAPARLVQPYERGRL